MGIAVLILFYGSGLFFVIASLVMLFRYINAPVHLHWELSKESSVYEMPEYWTKARRNVFNKLTSIILDILLLRGYYQQNRSFWYWLIIFHSGLYLLIIWHIWLFAGSLVHSVEANPLWWTVLGYVATGMIFIGSAGILAKRILDKELRAYYPLIHYIKWAFVIITLAGGFYAVLVYFDGNITSVLAYVREQLSFEMEHKIHAPVVTSIHLLLVFPWLIYLPFSHSMKVFLRYYHELHWDDKPNLVGSDVEKKVKKLLDQPVSWSAPHIQPGRTWAEIASEERGSGDDKADRISQAE